MPSKDWLLSTEVATKERLGAECVKLYINSSRPALENTHSLSRLMVFVAIFDIQQRFAVSLFTIQLFQPVYTLHCNMYMKRSMNAHHQRLTHLKSRTGMYFQRNDYVLYTRII